MSALAACSVLSVLGLACAWFLGVGRAGLFGVQRGASAVWLWSSVAFYHVGLVARLTAKLLWFLLTGTKTWVFMSARLMLFVVLLLPGLLQMLAYWLLDPTVIKNVPYTRRGAKDRNLLDIYLPPGEDGVRGAPPRTKRPVFIFFTGGAWVIGYKLWGALMAKTFSENNVVAVVPDVRNFPQGKLDDMLDDVDSAVRWVLRHIGKYGGDPSHVVLAGQSAGAHLAAMAMLRQARLQQAGRDVRWSPAGMVGFAGISGPYDLPLLESHLHKRGLDSSILRWISDNDLQRYSPLQNVPVDCSGLPPVWLYHGESDATIPVSITLRFAAALEASGAKVTARTFLDWTHTEPILEGPLSGDDSLCHDILQSLLEETSCESLLKGPSNEEDPFSDDDDAPSASRGARERPEALLSPPRRNGGEAFGAAEVDLTARPQHLPRRLSSLPTAVPRARCEPLVHPSLVAVARKVNPF